MSLSTISASRVSAVSLKRPSSGNSSMWSSPSRSAPCGFQLCEALAQPSRTGPARRRDAAHRRSRRSRRARSGRVPRQGRRSNPARRKTAPMPRRCAISVRQRLAPSNFGMVERVEVDAVEAAHVEGDHLRAVRTRAACERPTPQVEQNMVVDDLPIELVVGQRVAAALQAEVVLGHEGQQRAALRGRSSSCTKSPGSGRPRPRRRRCPQWQPPV